MKLNYKVFGHGKPLIILHGVFGMLDNWNSIAKKLSEEFLVYTIDQRNHGRSPHSDIFNYESLANDLYDFIISHNIKNPTIIGHSMGGKVAMHFAQNYPNIINKTIIIDIGIKQYPPDHIPIFNALFNLDLKSFSNRDDINTKLKQSINQENIRQFLLKNIAKNKGKKGYHWKFNLQAIYDNYEGIINEIQLSNEYNKECLFIKGEHSDYILDKDKVNIKKIFPKAKFITIENAGHWLHAEQPKALIKAISEFI